MANDLKGKTVYPMRSEMDCERDAVTGVAAAAEPASRASARGGIPLSPAGRPGRGRSEQSAYGATFGETMM
jgi:hypothetical protein